MQKIYFLTRSYLPDHSGGVLIRLKQIDFLKNAGYNVIVVTPNYLTDELISNSDLISIPYKRASLHFKFASRFEKIGIYDDYLKPWVEATFKILLPVITKNDIVFATSGGELGCIKLASMLKSSSGCKFVINFHDPINNTSVNGYYCSSLSKKRDQLEFDFIKNSDLIITSSKSNHKSLSIKYPQLSNLIKTSYFGYINSIESSNFNINGSINIMYAGIFGVTQSPEILAEAIQHVSGMNALFVGNSKNYKPLKKYSNSINVRFQDSLPYNEFINFAKTEACVGFVSLKGNYWGACVPSKIFEYVNLGLPIVGSLPAGDAFDIINNRNLGLVSDHGDVKGLIDILNEIKSEERFQFFKSNVLNEKPSWSFEYQFNQVVDLLSQL